MPELYPNQQRVADTLISKKIAPVKLPYGSGKSPIVIKTIEAANGSDRNLFQTVVLCPKRNIRTWLEHYEKWQPHCAVVMTEKELKLSLALGETSRIPTVFISNHNAAAKLFIARLPDPFAFILDETTVAKNPKAKISKDIEALIRYWNPQRVYGLTGNPRPENATELWQQFQCLYRDANPLGQTYYAFLRKWFLKVDFGGYVLRHELESQFNALVRSHLVEFTREEMQQHNENVGITDRQYILETYTPSPRQKELLQILHKKWELPAVGLDGEQLEYNYEYNHKMTILQKELQILSGFYYGVKSTEWNETTSDRTYDLKYYCAEVSKLTRLREILDELISDGHTRIVIWRNYHGEGRILDNALLDAYPEMVSSVGLGYADDNETLIDFASADPELRILIIPLAMARGLNDLVTASVDIYYGNTYKQELRDQAEKRIDRIGQKSKSIMHIDLAAEDSVEMDLVNALRGKNLTSDKLNTLVRERYKTPKGREEVENELSRRS